MLCADYIMLCLWDALLGWTIILVEIVKLDFHLIKRDCIDKENKRVIRKKKFTSHPGI